MFAIIPYKPEVHLNYIPIFSIIICIICVYLHYSVENNLDEVESSANYFCEKYKSRGFKNSVKSIYGQYTLEACSVLLMQVHSYPDEKIIIDEFVNSSKKLSIYSKSNSKKYVKKYLTRAVTKFKESKPPEYLVNKYVYVGGSMNVSRMVSSSFAHASWLHLIGNVLGYVSFGLLVELIIGPFFFIALFLTISISVGLASSVWYGGSDIPNLFLGLSGVVFGMMGALVYLWPQARIKAILWVVIIVKNISLPAWVIAVFYISWNVHYVLEQADSNTNFIAHIAGAIAGFLFSLILLRKKKEDLIEMLKS